MFKNFKTVLILLLVISFSVDQHSCYSISASWVFRGSSVENNTVLTFNKDDSLSIGCTTSSPASVVVAIFSITKGSSPPTSMNFTSNTDDSLNLVYTDAQTVIYDDFNGVYSGYENFIFLSKSLIGELATYKYMLYMNVGVLKSTDAGTYYCSTALMPFQSASITLAYANSGGVTIQVNTKPGQARSSRANARNLLTYSAVLLSAASKLLF